MPFNLDFLASMRKPKNPETNFERVGEFHEVFDCLRNDTPTVPTKDEIKARLKLILEETLELFHEFGLTLQNPKIVEDDSDIWATGNFDLHKIAKENADLLYVTYGQDIEMGIPIDKVFKEVHNSNLTKLTADGQVLRRHDGKVQKSDQYKPADIKSVFATD